MSEIQNLDEQSIGEHLGLIQERSGLATVALVCSLIVCCPLTTILGPILGVIALVRLPSKPHLKGKGFAWSSIIVGIIATAIWVVLGMFTFDLFSDFVEQTRATSTETIKAGYEGDYKTFRSHLTRTSSQVSDEEIQSFIEILRERYGNFDSAFLNLEEQDQTAMDPTPRETPIPIRFVFETTDAIGFIMFEFVPSEDWYEMQIGCIKIEDVDQGDIIFPLDSYCAPAMEKSQTNETDS